MQTSREITNRPSPGGRPQPLAFVAGSLWVGCWDTASLYALDTASWTVREEIALPGKPYGLAGYRDALYVVVSLGEDDDRYAFRIVPGEPFDAATRVACPDLTGSHLASHGDTLYLTQQSYRRVLAIDSHARAEREIALPTRCAGMAFDGNACRIIAADDEFDELTFAALDLESNEARVEPISAIDPEARGLAFDGSAWWTCHRERSRIVSFAA